MNKKKLRTMKIETADDLVIQVARRAGKDCRYIISAFVENDMLTVNFYSVTALKLGGLQPIMRTFLTKEDYITQDLLSEKTHWLTASFNGMDCTIRPCREWWEREKYGLSDFRSEEDMNTIMDFFEEYKSFAETPAEQEVWLRIERCQNAIKERRLKERHDRELEKTDKLMATIHNAPKRFFNWVWKTGMEFSQYLIYKDIGKGKAECECLVCHTHGTVNRAEIYMRNNENGKCPFCGKKVTFKASGRMPAMIENDQYFDYVEPTSDGFLFRVFRAERKITRSDDRLTANVEDSILEVRRAFYTFEETEEGIKSHYEPYEWGVYKQRGDMRWCPNTEHQPCWINVLYPNNLPAAWAHTPIKYSALEIYAKNCPDRPMRYEDAINFYLQYPKMEWLIKMGLYQLTDGLMHYWCGEPNIYLDRDTIYQILDLNKEHTKILQAVDGDCYIVDLLRKIEKAGVYITPETLMEYYSVFGTNSKVLQPEYKHATIHKICKYIRSEAPQYNNVSRRYSEYYTSKQPKAERDIHNMVCDWLDYIEWCRELGYDLTNRSVYFPKNFKAMHDRTYRDYQAKLDKVAAEKQRRMDEAIRQIQKEVSTNLEDILNGNEEMEGLNLQNNGLLLVVPKSGEEIRAEGEALHNCLSTYVGKVANGETSIFFIREAENSDVPYCAMEYRDGKVIQVRGKYNHAAPENVVIFANAFAKALNERKAAS